MKIEVFGTEGCKTCSNLKEKIEDVVEKSEKNVKVEKVTDLKKMAEIGIMTTPAVVVDGDVKYSGKMLNEEEIEKLIN